MSVVFPVLVNIVELHLAAVNRQVRTAFRIFYVGSFSCAC